MWMWEVSVMLLGLHVFIYLFRCLFVCLEGKGLSKVERE